MHPKVSATTTAPYSIVYKDSNMLWDLGGTTSDHSMSKNMSIMRELKTVIWIGLFQENSLPLWVLLKTEMQTIGMGSIPENT